MLITFVNQQSTSTLRTFILALVKNSAAQKKAQQELDSVLGEGNLPTFEDRPTLPYINAVVKELIRWTATVPMGQSSASSDSS